VRIAFDMETRDPDDALTLCLLATHPAVELAAVTVNPGTRAQLGVVRRILDRLDARDVPVGARDPGSVADALSAFHHEWLGDPGPAEADGAAHEVLATAFAREGTVLVGGAPLHNLRDLLRHHAETAVGRAVLQGGFAGDDLVAPEDRLPRFAGRATAESHNFGANKRATLLVLQDPRMRTRDLVSKNVTHGVLWDAPLHHQLRGTDGLTAGMRLAHEAMDVYLRARPEGKALHDPLAACAALRPEICRWAEVQVTYAGGRWGAEASPGSSTRITVGVDQAAFLRTLVEPAEWA
jgi:pyrimidine-specific ribonucleoside hydrolase